MTQRKTTHPIVQKIMCAMTVESWILSFSVSFFLLVLFRFYRHFTGYPFNILSAPITESFLKFCLVIALLSVTLWFLFCAVLERKVDLARVLVIATFITALLYIVTAPERILLCAVLAGFCLVPLRYFYSTYPNKCILPAIPEKVRRYLVILFFSALVGGIAVLRHLVYQSRGFDLGIFDQILHNISSWKPPIYTLTGTAVNHMTRVHFSPVLYLLVPFYKIFPSPITLILSQVVLVALAVIPLRRLSESYGLDALTVNSLITVFLFFPGILGGLFYDFHEVAFYPLLLLTLLLSIEKENLIGFWLAFILTLSVKEDSAIYLVSIGLFELLRKDRRGWQGVALIIGSVIYFAVISNFILDTSAFEYRYENLIADSSKSPYIELFKIFFTQPLYLLSEILTEEKITFLLVTFLPLAFIPLTGLVKLPESVFFLPLLAINLIPNWKAQYSIQYQYSFGSAPLYLFLMIRFLAGPIAPSWKKTCSALAVFATLIVSVSFFSGTSQMIHDFVNRDDNDIAVIRRMAAQIPANAELSTSDRFYPHFSQREQIYMEKYRSNAEYLFIDLRKNVCTLEQALRKMESLNGILIDQKENCCILFRSQSSGESSTSGSSTEETASPPGK